MGKVTVQLNEWRGYSFKLKSFIEDLNRFVDSVPAESQDDIFFELDAEEIYGGYSAYIRLKYERPKNQQEIDKENKFLAKRAAARIAADKIEYERLKKQFEPKTN